MAKYDLTRLDKLGERRRDLRAQLKEVQQELEKEVPTAFKAGVIQAEIARRTGMTRESIGQLCLPPDQRWKRPRKASADA